MNKNNKYLKNKKLKEAYSFNSENGDKSFDELYAGRDELFEDVDSIIDPRMAKLFESIYNSNSEKRKPLKKLKEDINIGTDGWEEDGDGWNGEDEWDDVLDFDAADEGEDDGLDNIDEFEDEYDEFNRDPEIEDLEREFENDEEDFNFYEDDGDEDF